MNLEDDSMSENAEHAQTSSENVKTSPNILGNIPITTSFSEDKDQSNDSMDIVNISIKCTKSFRRRFNAARGHTEQQDFIVQLLDEFEKKNKMDHEIKNGNLINLEIDDSQMKLLKNIKTNRKVKLSEKNYQLEESLEVIIKGMVFAKSRLMNRDNVFYTGL